MRQIKDLFRPGSYVMKKSEFKANLAFIAVAMAEVLRDCVDFKPAGPPLCERESENPRPWKASQPNTVADSIRPNTCDFETYLDDQFE